MPVFIRKYCCLILAALLFCPAADILANRLSLPTPGGQSSIGMEKQESPREPGDAQNPPVPADKTKTNQASGQGNNAPIPGQDAKDGMIQPSQEGQQSSPKHAEESIQQPNSSDQVAGKSDPNAGNKAGESEPANSLASVGEKRDDATGEPLHLPERTESIDFLAGAWNFEYDFVGSDGNKYKQDFIFNADGRGQTILRDEKEYLFVADALAQLEGNSLRIVTGPFIDEKTGAMYAPEYIECKNGSEGVICEGTDGFFAWQGERLLQDKSGLAYLPESSRSGKIEKEYPGSNKQSAGQNASNARENASTSDRSTANTGQNGNGTSEQKKGSDSQSAKQAQQTEQAFLQGKFAELSAEGAELSPIIMEKSSKAKGDAKNLSLAALGGDWRFSRDFARREDGRSLALEFHFDNTGKGYSVISDERGNGIKTHAEASMTKNGHIRVKTDAYGDSFYPTFMECRPGKPDLICDVSNGWTRMENGKLVSLSESASNSHQDQMAEILQMPTQNEQKNPSRGASVADILSDFSTGETSSSSSSASSTQAKSHATKSSQMILPKSSNDTKFLQGSWRCNTGLVRTSDNKPVVVEFSFNNDGGGSAIIREHSGTVYKAAAKASMQKGILRINTSMFESPTSNGHYNKCFIECRDDGSRAICSGENGGVRWDNATFTRIK